MALPRHSPPPPPFSGPGSPPRMMNGYPESQSAYPIYGPQPRQMLPPSPQHYHNRYPPNPTHAPAPHMNTYHDSRAPFPPQKRPGSSMSISSMLGAEPDKPHQEHYLPNGLQTSRPTSIPGPPMSLGAVMSPPQYPAKTSIGDYSYKPRSQTPDRIGGSILGNRPHRSSSGSMMQRPGPFYDQEPQAITKPGIPRYGEPLANHITAMDLPLKTEREERLRRTSLSGILQRPESQPQATPSNGHFNQQQLPISRPESAAPALPNGDRYGPSASVQESGRLAGFGGSYDTRPPGFGNIPRQSGLPLQTSKEVVSEKPQVFADFKRQQANGSEHRGLAGILNQSNEPTPISSNMARQDSVQSQGERSIFGDRYRSRPFSPFAGSVASQNQSANSVPTEEPGRKGSDELSQHRAILGLAAESKRGRYSPLPQAVQGAQAQTPVPDSGIQNEHGRVFAGLGGTGMGTGSTNTTPAQAPLSASPFKQNEGYSRLSEENLMKMSRSASGMGKRSRKIIDDGNKAESETGEGKKGPGGRGNKRSKYSANYKTEPEESNLRMSTLAAADPARRVASPIIPTNNNQHNHQQAQNRPPVSEPAPVFKPKKTIRISAILAHAKRLPRKHIGSFIYNPEVTSLSPSKHSPDKFDVSIRPNILPSFTEADQMNCTYTLRVPKLWLQRRERSLIRKEACLWGSGIYSDDSDIVAAAMHTGFIRSVSPDNIDQTLLDRVVSEQNTKIEGLVDLPEKPVEPEEGKDAIITLVVMPTLETYTGSARFGVHSRTWPEDNTKTAHDGVSFMITKVEYVAGAVEARRMGRTGAEKRARIQKELEDRKRSHVLQKQMFEKAKRKMVEKQRPQKTFNNNNLATHTSMPKSSSTTARATNTEPATVPLPVPLNVGQAPGDWLRQVEAIGAA